MPPKPKANSGPDLSTPNPEVELQKAKAAWSVASSNYDTELSQSTGMIQKLLEENSFLKKKLSAVKQNEMDTFSTHSSRSEALSKQLEASNTLNSELKARLARVPIDIKAAADAAKAVMQTEINDLSRRLRDRESALERLADFRRERDDLVGQVTRIQAELDQEVAAHKNDIALLERRNIRDREQVKASMFETLKTAKVKILADAAEGLDGTSKRILAENEQAFAELAFQSSEAERVARINEQLVGENKQLRMDYSIVFGERTELLARTEVLSKNLRLTRMQLHSALLRINKTNSSDSNSSQIQIQATDELLSSATETNTGEDVLETLIATSGLGAAESWKPTHKKHREIIKEKVKLPRGIKVSIPPRTAPQTASSSSSSSSFQFEGEGETGGTGEFSDRPTTASTLLGGSIVSDGHSVTTLAMAAAVRDRDAALDALVVLDSQRLEMLALCDKTAMALLRAASELRPLIDRASAELIEQDAGRLASRPNAFTEEVESLLNDALGETSSSSQSIKNSSSGVKSVYAFIRYLASRMQFFSRDAVRAVPEPANLDTMIRQSQSALRLADVVKEEEEEEEKEMDFKTFKRPNTEHSSTRRSNTLSHSEEKKDDAILPSLPSLPRAALNAAVSRRDKKSTNANASTDVSTSITVHQPKYNAYIHEGSNAITTDTFERPYPFERPVLVPRGRLSPSRENH